MIVGSEYLRWKSEGNPPRLSCSTPRPSLLYRAETWTKKATIKKLQTLSKSSLRRILKIHELDTISNTEQTMHQWKSGSERGRWSIFHIIRPWSEIPGEERMRKTYEQVKMGPGGCHQADLSHREAARKNLPRTKGDGELLMGYMPNQGYKGCW